jgi:hypothetical protein
VGLLEAAADEFRRVSRGRIQLLGRLRNAVALEIAQPERDLTLRRHARERFARRELVRQALHRPQLARIGLFGECLRKGKQTGARSKVMLARIADRADKPGAGIDDLVGLQEIGEEHLVSQRFRIDFGNVIALDRRADEQMVVTFVNGAELADARRRSLCPDC